MALSQSYQRLRLERAEGLEIEARILAPDFQELFSLSSGQLESAPFLCAQALFRFLVQRKPEQTLLRKKGRKWIPSPRIYSNESSEFRMRESWLELFSIQDRELLKGYDLRTLLGNYDFIGLPGGIQEALVFWMDHPERLDLLTVAPTPLEMLHLQSQGRRCVVVFHTLEQLQILHSKKEPFEFLLHDLEHAQKFFLATRTHQIQTEFFKSLLRGLKSGIFESLLREDSIFRAQFEYLMSDMNSHPEHLKKYLEAIHLNALLRRCGRGPSEELPSDELTIQSLVMREISTGKSELIETPLSM